MNKKIEQIVHKQYDHMPSNNTPSFTSLVEQYVHSFNGMLSTKPQNDTLDERMSIISEEFSEYKSTHAYSNADYEQLEKENTHLKQKNVELSDLKPKI